MISVVIVNFNLSQEILNCLASFERHKPSVDHEIIIVDNHSTDPEFAELKSLTGDREHLSLIALDSNRGFGSACNIGAKRARGEHLCFLNPDTLAESDFLQTLLATQERTGAALIGPAYDEPGRLEFAAGVFPSLLLESLNVFFVGRHVEAWRIAQRRRRLREAPFEVDWVLGACLFIRADKFRDIGGFDEAFFLFFEEMDLCQRLRANGERVLFAPACRVRHIGSVSGRKNYALFTERFYEGKTRYLAKHYSGGGGRLMQILLWLQLRSQILLWSVPWHRTPVRAAQKKEGLGKALAFFHQHPFDR